MTSSGRWSWRWPGSAGRRPAPGRRGWRDDDRHAWPVRRKRMRRCCFGTTTAARPVTGCCWPSCGRHRTWWSSTRAPTLRVRAGGASARGDRGRARRTAPLGVVPVAANTGVGPRPAVVPPRPVGPQPQQDHQRRAGRVPPAHHRRRRFECRPFDRAHAGPGGPVRPLAARRQRLHRVVEPEQDPGHRVRHRDQQGSGGGQADRRARPVSAGGCLHLGSHRAEHGRILRRPGPGHRGMRLAGHEGAGSGGGQGAGHPGADGHQRPGFVRRGTVRCRTRPGAVPRVARRRRPGVAAGVVHPGQGAACHAHPADRGAVRPDGGIDGGDRSDGVDLAAARR